MARSEAPTSDPAAVEAPRAVRAWWTVFVFFLGSIVTVVNASVISMVVDPVRADLHISDAAIGLVQGMAFGVSYALVALPLGLIADKVSRRRLLAAGTVVWSLATLASGLAPNVAWLFAARVLTGMGEATLAPCAVSIISDLFPARRRGLPISLFLMGQALAVGFAIMAIGAVLQAARGGAFAHWALVGGLPPWRIAFLTCGAVSLASTLLLTTVRDPPRQGILLAGANRIDPRPVLRFLKAHWPIFASFYAAYALVALNPIILGGWGVTYMTRVVGAPQAFLIHWAGSTGVIAGVLGSLTGGFAMTAAARIAPMMGKFAILIGGSVLMLAATGVGLIHAPSVALALWTVSIFTLPLLGTTSAAALQEMAPADMRGFSISLLSFTSILSGAAASSLVGVLTAHVYRNDRMVGVSMATLGAPAVAVGAVLFGLCFLAVRRALTHDAAFGAIFQAGRAP